LLADSDWATAICGSSYFESVLNCKVPAMTSNTTPSGTCIGSSAYDSSTDYYKAFDGNADLSHEWASASNDNVGGYIGYTFPSAVAIKKVMLYNYTTNQNIITKFKLQGSNGTWTDVGTEQNATTGENNYDYPSNNTTYTSHRVYCTAYAGGGGASNLNVFEVQFYGRVDV